MLDSVHPSVRLLESLTLLDSQSVNSTYSLGLGTGWSAVLLVLAPLLGSGAEARSASSR